MASKATEKYTAIYLNSAKKHNAQPIYEKQSVAPDRGNLVQVSGSDIDKYSKTTQKYIKDYSNQSVASFNPAEAARLRQEAVQRMMGNFVRDTNAGKKAYNEVTALLQSNQARKAAESNLQQKLASLPPAEISSGNRTNAATEALAKANNVRNGLSYGLARGLGYGSLVNAIGSAYENATGEIQPSLHAFNEETERAQRTAPNAFSAGNVAGNIALMGSVGNAAGAGMEAVGATGRAARLGANALAFGGAEAIHGLGDVAQGNITPGRYAKNIGTSALGGAAGGFVSDLAGTGIANVLRDKKMMTPFMEYVRQTAAGTAFGAGDLAARQAVAYGTNDESMKMDRRQIAEQLATSFGFSMVTGAIRTLNTTAAAKSALQSQVDQATSIYQELMSGSFTEDEFIQRINTLMQFTDDLRNSVNSQYLAGNQTAVNNMNDALDVIQESLRGRLAGMNAGNVGNNILVDNINGNGYGTTMPPAPSTGPTAPSTEPQPPTTEDQLAALARQSFETQEAQRQALYDAGKNHEQNIQPLMDSATMLTEEEKLAAVRQGNQDATDAEIKEAMSAPGSAVQPISDADLNEYIKAGTKKNVHKRNTVAAGKDIILRTATEAKKYISNAIHGNGLETVAFGKVGQRLVDDANKYTGGKIDLKGMFLELIPNNIKHAYQQHLTAKYDNNIDLTEQDFLNIPRYIAEYDDFIEAVDYKNDREIKLGKRLDNGGVVIIQAVSNNRGALQFKNMWGLTNEGYEEYIKNRSSQVSQEAFLSASSTGYDGASSTNIIPSEVQTVKENLNVRAEQTGADSLRGRSIRVLSQRAGEQAGGIQPAAGGAGEEGQTRTYADPEAEVLRIGEEIKGEEVVRTAVPGQTVYTVEGDTKATLKAKSVAAAVGAKGTTLYASGDDGLKVKSGDRVLTSRGTCDPSIEKFSACVNDPRADAAQIIQHEAVELGVARGTVKPQEIYDSIKATDDLVSSAIDELVEMYVQYGSEQMDTAHALKELFCDAGGGINQFKDVEGWEDVAATMDAVSAYIRPMLNEALGGALDAEPEAPEVSADTSDPVAVYSEQNNSKAVQYSIDQFAQANGFQLVRNSEGMPYSIMDPATGKEVRPRDITPERVKNTPQGRMIAAAEKTGAIDAKTADAQRRFTADVMKLCAQYKDQATVWEIAGATAFSSFKANSDSQYGSTVDFGTICSKTQAIVDVMSNTMVEKGRGLKRDEVLKVYDAVAHTGLSVPCPVCYVFSRWIGVPSLLETMRRGQERFGENTTVEAVNGYIHNMETKYHGKDGINNTKVKVQNKVQKLQQELLKARGNDAEIGRIAKETKAVEKELADLEIYNWVTQVRCKTDSKRNPIRDSKGRVTLDPKYKSVPNDVLLNLNRTGEFARDYPKSWLYRTTRGAGMGKAILPYSGAGLGDAVRGAGIAKPTLYGKGQNPFFNGDDKKASRDLTNAQKRMRAQNLIGGQRLQSTSDFRAEWGLDYVTDLMEMQNVGAKGQLYTKVIEAVDLLATAGNEVNLSIMGKGNGYHKDSKGRPVLGVEDFSSVTGIDFKAAYEKVKKYDNVQMILVGLNDTHVRLALADKRIGFVIPWHASGSSEDVLRTLMDSNNEKLVKGTDYTPVQDDKVIDYGDKKLNAKMKAMRKLREDIVMAKLKKGVTDEQQALLDENKWLQDLYNRYYVDESAEEYGVKLSGKQAEKIFPYEYWDKSLKLKDADQNGYRFQEYCASLGLKPRFSGAVVNGEMIGDFTNDPGYWKLLIDRSMYNNDGTYHEPQVIDVTKIKINQIPMTVNSNLYRDDTKLKQATMDSLRALDRQPNDVSMTMDVSDSEIDDEPVQASTEFDRKAREVTEESVDAMMDNGYTGKEVAEAVEFGGPVHYSTRLELPPRKTITAYKAFYAHDGKLYPPMVSNDVETEQNKGVKKVSGTLKGLETPVGVWIDADVGALAYGDDGKPLRNTKGRLAVKNAKGGGTLAFRPGWHLGLWPDAKQFNVKDPVTGALKACMPDGLVFAKCSVAADYDYQLEALGYGMKDNGKFDRTQAGLPRIPKNGYYMYRTNVDPTTAPWIITGAIKVEEILDDDMSAEICAKYGITADPRASHKKINLADYGLKAGPVTPTEDMDRFLPNDAVKANAAALEAALADEEFADAYVARSVNFDDPEIVKELARNKQDAAFYKEAQAKYGNKSYAVNNPNDPLLDKETFAYSPEFEAEDHADDWLDELDLSDLMASLENSTEEDSAPRASQRAAKRVDYAKKKLEKLGLEFNGTKTLGWTEERIDKYLDGNHFGSSNKNYAQAYIAYISPKQFLSLTMGAGEGTISKLQDEASAMGMADLTKLDKDLLQPMFLNISNERDTRAAVSGHEGRHRMILLGKAGFEKVPVLLFNSANKYDKQYKSTITLKPENQTGGFISKTREVTLQDVVPFSQGNIDLIKSKFGPTAVDVSYSSSLNLKDLSPEEKERFAQYRKQYQDRLRARRENRKARQDLLKRANKAVRLAKNRPGYAAEAIKDLVKDLDLVSVGMRSNTKGNLTKKYFEILQMRQDDPNYAALHSEKDMQRVERLFKKQIKDMDLDDVKDLITELSALIHYQETQNKLFKDSKGRDAAEAGRQWVKELNELKPLDITNGVKQLGAKYLRNNLSPERAARMISGYKRGSVAQELVRNLEDGLTTQLAFEQKADELFRPFLENKANRDFVKNASKQNIEITDADGNKAMISPAMRVALYMHSRNRDNLVHIADGGLKIPNPKLYEQGKIKDAYNRGRKLKLQPTDIQAILADMTPQEQEYAQLLTTFFDDYSKDAINETSLTLDGIYRAIVDEYFPITSDPDFLAKSMDLVNDPTLEGWGNLKARQEGSVNPILLEDATKVLQRHIKKTGQYAGLAIPLRDFQKVYGYVSTGHESSVQKAIGNAWDQETKDYLTQFIKDLNTGGRQAERGIVENLRSAYAGSVLTLNPSVALKQTTSYFMAGSILDVNSLMKGLGEKFTEADKKYMDSITPWGWARRKGQSTIELGDMARQTDSIFNKVPNWNQIMDVWTTNKLFKATEESIKKEYPNLKRGDKEYDEALAEKYNQVLWRTQPQYEAMFRPEYLRKTDIGSRTFGMFKTESMQMSGELIDALGQWRADSGRAKSGDSQARYDKAESAKNFARTFASWVASNMAFAVMGTALNIVLMHKGKQYRNDAGEIDWQTLAEKTALNFVGSSIGGMFYGSTLYDIGQYLYKAFKGEKSTWYDIEAPGLPLINDTISSLGNLIGYMVNPDATVETKMKAAAKFGLNVSKFTPAGFAENVVNMINSVILYNQDRKDKILGSYISGNGLLSDTSPDKNQYAKMAIAAYQRGDDRRGDLALGRTGKTQLEKALGAEGKKDENGETISGSKKADALDKISNLDISDENKRELIEAMYSDMSGLSEWTGDVDTFIDVANAKATDKQDGVVNYLQNSSLTEEEMRLLWELAAGYKDSTFDSKMGY